MAVIKSRLFRADNEQLLAQALDQFFGELTMYGHKAAPQFQVSYTVDNTGAHRALVVYQEQ